MRSHSDPHRGNERALAFLRICVGILFLIFGQYKVFGTQFTLHGGFEFWINKFLQGGAYPFMAPILRGFVLPHARPIAFLVSGEMAYAYFHAHAPGGFWPINNHGELAVLFCFLWLYIAAAGPGPWSIDAMISRGSSK